MTTTTQISEIVLCKNCRHMVIGQEGPYAGIPLCGRSLILDFVNGYHKHYSCQTERAWDTPTGCGRAAKFFEPADAQ